MRYIDGLTGDSVMVLNHLSSATVSATSIKQWTSQDPILSCVRRFIETGWPEQPQQLSKEFQPYVSLRLELSALDGCIVHGSRVVIPPPGRQLVLDELHDTHTGITKMKSIVRSFVWWPLNLSIITTNFSQIAVYKHYLTNLVAKSN